LCAAVTTGPYCASASVETPTFRVSIAARSASRAAPSAVFSPTGTTTGSAMQRSPAEPKAAPARSFTPVEVGVGHDDAVVLGAAHGLDALPVRGAARIDVLGDVGEPTKLTP
jgi:hypothetical protein